jgi:calcineurin-like phosphoesterase
LRSSIPTAFVAPVNYPDGALGVGRSSWKRRREKSVYQRTSAHVYAADFRKPIPLVDAAVAKMRNETANIIVDVHRRDYE